DRYDDIKTGERPFAVLRKTKGLQAERGESGVAAADSGHDELARVRADEDASVGSGQGGKEADDERPGHVDDQRADRKGLADMVGGETRKPVARDSAEHAAQHDPQPCHGLTIPLPSPADVRGRREAKRKRAASRPGSRRVALEALLDRAEDGAASGVLHLDPHDVAEFEVRRLWLALEDGLDRAKFGDAGVARAALLDPEARAAVRALVRHRARADDRACADGPGPGRVDDQRRKVERHVYACVGPAERL